MKCLLKSSNSESGFTLVAAVAIPNFQKYQARSKTTEAKIQLAAIYVAEESFFSTYNIYHTCLKFMGYDPREEINSRIYTTGFTHSAVAIDATAYISATTAGINTVDCPEAATNATNTTFFPAGKGLGNLISDSAHLTSTTNGTQTNSSTMTFLAGAAGIIHKEFTAATGASGSSYFTIDQSKKISTIRTGY
jgi:type IV pilus assembly protein PilA